MLPNVVYGDVPVIMFKSTNIANESEALLEKTLNRLGYSAGLINKNGLSIDGRIWSKSAVSVRSYS